MDESFESKVTRFYLEASKSDDDEAIRSTCEKFNIDEDQLNYIIMVDFVDTHMT